MIAARWRPAAAAGLILASLAQGCRKRQPPPPAPVPTTRPVPATPIDIKRAETGGPIWEPAWDKIVEDALPPEMLSRQVGRDVRPFCPRFDEIGRSDRSAFWAYLFQALAGAEAGLKPTSHVRHSQAPMEVRDEVTGMQVRTEGLLQLAYEDEKRYGCDFDWEADRRLPAGDPARTILQPKNNLDCGVKIMAHELLVEHKPLLSRTQYWSTLQPGTFSYDVFRKQMANVPDACKVLRPAGRTGRRRRELSASR